MLTLYLICLIFGGVFLVVTLLSGSDMGGDMDFHGDFAGDVHGDLSADADADGQGLAEAIKFFSFRNVVFFLAFFGLTGLCLTLVGTPSLLTLVTAAGIGLFAGTLVQKIMRYLRRTESGTAMNLKSIEGLKARVSINLSRNRVGKIVANTGEQYVQVLAKAAEEAGKDQFIEGEVVLIVRVEDDLAMVAEEEFIRDGAKLDAF